MSIMFNVPEAGNHLIKHGIVYTMRRKRTEGWQDLFVMGKLMKNRAYVSLEGQVFDLVLSTYVAHSGFDTLDKWRQAAKRTHGTEPENLSLYKVELKKEKDE